MDFFESFLEVMEGPTLFNDSLMENIDGSGLYPLDEFMTVPAPLIEMNSTQAEQLPEVSRKRKANAPKKNDSVQVDFFAEIKKPYKQEMREQKVYEKKVGGKSYFAKPYEKKTYDKPWNEKCKPPV